MKRIFTLLIFVFVSSNLFAQFPTIYASVASGNYDAAATWETFTGNATNLPGAMGTGTAAGGGPSGTHYVYIRSGHTVSMNGGNRSCLGMKVEATGKLWANETSARRLQVATGGTGFTAPQNWTIENNGTMGGPTDGLYFEPGTNCGTVTLAGTGTYQVQRIRVPGGLTAQVNVIIDRDIQLTQSANYAASLVYNPTATNNFSMTINSGKVASTTAADGYFHNNASTSTGGTYVYNVNGTLDLSSNTQAAANMTTFGPLANAPSSITLNVNGTMKLGTSFVTTSNAGNPGSLSLNILGTGVVDATGTTNLTIDPNYSFKISGTGSFKRTVGASDILFPIGVGTSYNPVIINNAGVSDVFSATVKSSIDNAVTDATKVVNRQWTITETVAGGTIATIKLGWVIADQAAGFNPLNPVVIARWTGTAYEAAAAVVTGTGTVSDPYIATATGFTSFSPFIVANASALPVNFSAAKAYSKEKGIQVDWSIATESNIRHYAVERSANGRDFSSVGIVESKGNSSTTASYTWFDAVPFNGANYYRVRALDIDGSSKYTSIMQVNISKGKTDVVIAPNPVRNNQLNVLFSDLEKGTYTLKVFNNSGQVVFTTQVTTHGGSLSQSLTLPSSVRAGIYNLQVSGNETSINKRIAIE
jgi:hypothetical protein